MFIQISHGSFRKRNYDLVVERNRMDFKEFTYNTGDEGSIPESRRSPGEGNGNPPQYSCLENSVDRGAWRVTVHGVSKSRTRLSDKTHMHIPVSIIYCKLTTHYLTKPLSNAISLVGLSTIKFLYSQVTSLIF